MMQLEQAQKLKMLEVEAYFRVKFTKEMEQSQEKQMAAAKHLEEMGSGIMMGGGKNLTEQAFRGLSGAGVDTGTNLSSMVNTMVKEGRLNSNDMRLSEYYMAQFELAEKFKTEPAKLSEELTKTYNKIFAVEAAQRNKDIVKQNEIADSFEKLTKGYSTMPATELNKLYTSLSKTYPELMKQWEKAGGYNISSTAESDFFKSLRIPTGPGPGQFVNSGVPTLTNPTGTTTGAPAPVPTLTPPPAAPATNFGDIGKILERVAFSANELVKNGNKLFTTTNNTVIDLNMLYTKTSEVGNAVITNGNTTIGELRNLKTLETNAYTELLRRTDATNALLDTLIGATAEASAKPININGKRVSDVMKNVSQRVYGITGA
jgi:hypothetical protein